MIDADSVKDAIIKLMVFVKQNKELLPPIQQKIAQLEEKKKPLAELVRKQEEENKLKAAETNQPVTPVVNPELQTIQSEIDSLNQKRVRIETDIQEAEMEIEKNKDSLKRHDNPNIKAEELLSNLKGFAEKTDNLVTGKKETSEAELSEELKKLKEKQGK